MNKMKIGCDYMKVIYLNCGKDVNRKAIFAVMNTS